MLPFSNSSEKSYRTISRNSSEYVMSKESSYNSRSIQNTLVFFLFVSISLIAEEPESIGLGLLALYLKRKKSKGA